MVGQTISHYKILAKLGEGGMGVVYRAEDTKLDRPVALKFLALHAIEDPEHKARFVREAKAAARLDHPNICSVYEIDEADGQTFLAMAYLEGQTVKDKIAERPLKLEEALDIAIQTAQGLQAAHEKRIVHRDIKSANLMFNPQGQVKIMDFGLAQLAERSKLTETATILGTPAYMSPEQAQGQKTDRRTDIWSLGVVIYEMVTGRLPFEGERQEAVLYKIGSEEPEPVTALRAGLPMELEWIVGKCLAKNAEERYQHADDLIVDLTHLGQKLKAGRATILATAASQQSVGTVQAAREIEHLQRRKQVVSMAVAGLALLSTLVFAFLWLSSPTQIMETPLRRFTLPTTARPAAPVISPNGRHVAYFTGDDGNRILWVQDLDEEEPRAIAGPEGDLKGIRVSWSPDSRFLAFGSANTLKSVSVLGGPAATLCECHVPGWAGRTAWTPDGESIIFPMGRNLYRIPAAGGEPELWLEPQQEGYFAVNPEFLPSMMVAAKLLYQEVNLANDVQVMILDRESGQREVLVAGRSPSYAPSGHVLYLNRDTRTLWAVPFSLQTMRASGKPFPVSEDSNHPSVSQDGTLVYLEGGGWPSQEQLVWCDRGGNRLSTIGQPQNQIRYPALSPDEKRVAVWGKEGGGAHIWIHEVERPVKTRLTSQGVNLWPIWSPKGDRIAFSSGRPDERGRDLYVKRADGSGEAAPLLLTEDYLEYLTDWSRDESILLFQRVKSATGGGPQRFDISYLKRTQDGAYKEVPFLTTASNENTPVLSPDGRFVAYVSDELGQPEIFIQKFPQGGDKERVSISGGTQPRWRADGKELFYVEGVTLMAVPVTTSPALTVGSPERLFSAGGLAWKPGDYLSYDVTPDGKKFVLTEEVEGDTDTERPATIHVVENWFAEFKDRQD